MAINKNSKAYQALLKQGYTDEQITQMSGAVASGQNTKDVVANTKAGATTTTTPTKTTTTTTTTPTKTTTTTPTTTQTTNTNLGQWNYGDDSTERQQQIINNLDNAYAKNPTQFSSWESFANAFNYNYSGRSDKERETMKNWYEQKFGTTQNQTPPATKTQVDATYDKNGNLHIAYSDGSTQIIPGGTGTQQGVVGGQTGLSADGKTYTFQPGYNPIYPEGEVAGDKSTAIANEGKLQQKSKTLSYQDDSQERYDQILKNLDSIYVTNPEYFTNRSTFDANFQIDQRSIGQQNLMVQWFYAKKKQEKDYNAISGLTDGQSIYDAVNGGGLTQDQLDLLKGTPQYDDYITITKEKKDLAVINNDPASLFIDNLPNNMEEVMEMIMAQYRDWDKYKPWEYMMSLYDGPDGQEVINQLKKDTKTALDWKAQYDSIDSNTRSELEGTGATKGYMQALIARRQNDMIPSLNMAYAQVQSSQTNYNLRHQSVTDLYGSYVDEANYEIDKYNARIQGFQQMWNVYSTVAKYDWDYKQKVRELELAEKYNNPQIDSDDPDEARRALQSALQTYYDTYGPIIKRDINKTIEDIYAYAKKNGVSLSQALQKNFVDQLQGKKEYKELQKQYVMGREYLYQKAGTATSGSSKSSTSDKSDTSSTGGVNPSASWWQQTSSANPTLEDITKIQSAVYDFISENGEGSVGGQCGHYVNQYLNSLGFGLNNIGDSIEDKASLINDNTPQVGSIMVMDSTKAPENGHVAIVVAYDPNTGIATVQDSNRKPDGIVRQHNIDVNLNKNKIRGYINPAKGLAYNNYNGAVPHSEFTGESGTIHKLNKYGYIDDLSSAYKYYNEKNQIASTASEAQALLNDYGITREQFAAQAENYSKYGPEAKSYVQSILDLDDIVTNLLDSIDDIDWSDLYYGEGKVWRANYNYIVQRQMFNYFKDLKSQGATFGAMSNAEWDRVESASTKLGTYDLDSLRGKVTFGQDKEGIKVLLQEIKDDFGRILMNNPAYDKTPYYEEIYKQQNGADTATGGATTGGTATTTGGTTTSNSDRDDGR